VPPVIHTSSKGCPRVAAVWQILQQAECELVRSTLAECDGNRKEAARKLGIGERTLYRKLNQYDLKV